MLVLEKFITASHFKSLIYHLYFKSSLIHSNPKFDVVSLVLQGLLAKGVEEFQDLITARYRDLGKNADAIINQVRHNLFLSE